MRASLSLLLLASAAAFGQPADLVLRNGKIVTMSAAAPVVQALAVRGETISAVGSGASACGNTSMNTCATAVTTPSVTL